MSLDRDERLLTRQSAIASGLTDTGSQPESSDSRRLAVDRKPPEFPTGVPVTA